MAKHYKDAGNFAHSSQVLASVTVMLAVSGSSSEKLIFFLFSQKLINRQLYRAVRLLPNIRFKASSPLLSHLLTSNLSPFLLLFSPSATTASPQYPTLRCCHCFPTLATPSHHHCAPIPPLLRTYNTIWLLIENLLVSNHY